MSARTSFIVVIVAEKRQIHDDAAKRTALRPVFFDLGAAKPARDTSNPILMVPTNPIPEQSIIALQRGHSARCGVDSSETLAGSGHLLV